MTETQPKKSIPDLEDMLIELSTDEDRATVVYGLSGHVNIPPRLVDWAVDHYTSKGMQTTAAELLRADGQHERADELYCEAANGYMHACAGLDDDIE